jgi:glucose dehydrogenase
MKPHGIGRLAGAAILALGALACSSGGSSPASDAIPPEVVANEKDWPLPGRDYRNSRATEDSTIDASTVASLRVAWEAPLPGSGAYGNASTTPLILGDTVFVQDLTSNVHAIDRATGAIRWRRQFDRFVIGPNGVAVGWGRLYAVDGTDDVVALDLATGEELWRRKITRTDTDGIDIQPTVFGRLVLASTVPVSLNGIYSGGDRGVLHALDVETGEVRWEFDTVIDDLWGNPEVNSGGGAWYPPAIDVDRGIVFWGVANPAPFPGTPEFPNGTSRPGPNLYTDSVVALDAATGSLAWYRQAIPHDIFDHDLVHTLIVEVAGDGRSRTVLVATGKGGRVLGHDIATGELLWETPVGRHENDDLTALSGPTDVWPGTFGGVLTPPSAADGVVYVATLNAPTTLSPDVPAYIGSRLDTAPGQIVAVDAATGAIVWDVEVAGDPVGATTVVNDLVFTATFAGRIHALDRATGRAVWTYDAPGPINGWPAVAGDLIVWPVGLARPPRLVAFRVGAP